MIQFFSRAGVAPERITDGQKELHYAKDIQQKKKITVCQSIQTSWSIIQHFKSFIVKTRFLPHIHVYCIHDEQENGASPWKPRKRSGTVSIQDIKMRDIHRSSIYVLTKCQITVTFLYECVCQQKFLFHCFFSVPGGFLTILGLQNCSNVLKIPRFSRNPLGRFLKSGLIKICRQSSKDDF